MTIQKRDKRKRRAVKSVPPELEEKSFIAPPIDRMVKNDNRCKSCGRLMFNIRCQCGWVRPINKTE